MNCSYTRTFLFEKGTFIFNYLLFNLKNYLFYFPAVVIRKEGQNGKMKKEDKSGIVFTSSRFIPFLDNSRLHREGHQHLETDRCRFPRSQGLRYSRVLTITCHSRLLSIIWPRHLTLSVSSCLLAPTFKTSRFVLFSYLFLIKII